MVDDVLTCYMKSYALDNTKLQQVGVWNATFSTDGKVKYMKQEVLYASFMGGYNVNDDMGASQYIHGPRGFNAMLMYVILFYLSFLVIFRCTFWL